MIQREEIVPTQTASYCPVCGWQWYEKTKLWAVLRVGSPGGSWGRASVQPAAGDSEPLLGHLYMCVHVYVHKCAHANIYII